MIVTDILQVPGTREVLNVMDVFGALSEYDMKLYAKSFGAESGRVLGVLAMSNLIFMDRNNGLVLNAKGFKINQHSVACFDTMLKIAAGRPFYVAHSRYQCFDYVMIIEGDDQTYFILDFANRGKERVRTYNEGLKPSGKNVPVFVFIDSSSDVLYERDEDGNEYLVPEEKYIEARVEMGPRYGKVELRTLRDE